MPNRLSKEKSPYLLQHKDNPVDWYPWGKEAFAKARKENKPVFLSIGYATCHWCHVMEHESFEDEEIAAGLNESFINIKVDREERPDIDSTYMTVCQMLNGQGGWPLTIIMTPEKEPFFAGTYIPKEARSGRIGLRQLIPGVTGMWKHKPENIEKAVASIKEGYAKSQQFESGPLPGEEAIEYAAEQFSVRFDDEYAGFGAPPKFPTPHNLMFLLRHWQSTGEDRFRDAVKDTLTAMRLGGIWDHVGYGFHRYSTDRKWLLPHFEKMLYDQALLMMAYTEGWQVTKEPLFKQTVYEIAEYVLRDLKGDQPAFYSAEDADSEGEEGKFYVWSTDEVSELLTDDEIRFFTRRFAIETLGNFKDEATRELTGTNIPHLTEPLNSSQAEIWETIRQKLFSARSERIRPLLDDKVLTDWNALMISALARAGAVFSEAEFTEQAEQAYDFILDKMWDGHTLFHRFKDGDTAIPGFADDYAFMMQAGIDLYESTFKASFLKSSKDLAHELINRFEDHEKGGLYFSEDADELPLGKQKQIYDGAVPSSNSVAMLNLIRLSRLTGDTSYEETANAIAKCFSADLIRSGSSITVSMMALQFLFNSAKEIVIAEGSEPADTLVKLLRKEYIPNKVLLYRPRNDEDLIFSLSEYIQTQKPVDDRTTLYICKDFSCTAPETDLDSPENILLKILE